MLLELAARVLVPLPTYSGTHSFLIGLELMLDRDIGYRFKPNSRFDINNYGFRDDNFAHVKKNGISRVLFLGDSFIMAGNISSEYSVPSILERNLGKSFEVFNLGIHGYGPDQSLILLKKVIDKWKPDLIILGIFPANDFNDIIKNKFFYLNGRGGVDLSASNVVKEILPSLYVEYLIGDLFLQHDTQFKYAYTKRTQDSLLKLFTLLFNDVFDKGLAANPKSEESKNKLLLMSGILKEFKFLSDKHQIPFFAEMHKSI